MADILNNSTLEWASRKPLLHYILKPPNEWRVLFYKKIQTAQSLFQHDVNYKDFLPRRLKKYISRMSSSPLQTKYYERIYRQIRHVYSFISCRPTPSCRLSDCRISCRWRLARNVIYQLMPMLHIPRWQESGLREGEASDNHYNEDGDKIYIQRRYCITPHCSKSHQMTQYGKILTCVVLHVKWWYQVVYRRPYWSFVKVLSLGRVKPFGIFSKDDVLCLQGVNESFTRKSCYLSTCQVDGKTSSFKKIFASSKSM